MRPLKERYFKLGGKKRNKRLTKKVQKRIDAWQNPIIDMIMKNMKENMIIPLVAVQPLHDGAWKSKSPLEIMDEEVQKEIDKQAVGNIFSSLGYAKESNGK